MVDQVNGTHHEEDNLVSEVVKPSSVNELKPKMRLHGEVQRLELYGAFVDIGLDTPAILHISKLNERVNRISDALTVGDEIAVYVESIDEEKGQVTLTMLEPLEVEWLDLRKGQNYSGTVTRLEKFGAFVDIGAEKEGLVHISELSHDYIKHPSEAVKPGDEIEVTVLGFSKRKRRIDLSRKVLLEVPLSEVVVEEIEVDEDVEEMPTSMEIALRQAMNKNVDGTAPAKSATATTAGPGSKKRNEQDDILSRTLKMGQDSQG